jgi:MoaA/NifB/PqqE/SkfB family radical SAM enzyme
MEEDKMSKLNEKNSHTGKVIHLLVTNLCGRDCPFCFNKQYDINSIPYVTDDELKNAEVLCITGGEPITYANPNEIAKYYKNKYHNIKKVYLYANAFELYNYMRKHNLCDLEYIDGYSVSVKTSRDEFVFDVYLSNNDYFADKSNKAYVFEGCDLDIRSNYFETFKRYWQEGFTAANDSIFRRV